MKVITVESESVNKDKWKWWHNWQTCAHKMEQQLILEKPDSWHWKVKVITVKSESDDWENESENSEKWKWSHNWPTYAHKMEQQLFLNQP